MIPGPYSICHTKISDSNDCVDYLTIKFGYDTAEQAYNSLPDVAKELNLKADDCIVIRHIEREEAVEFTD